MSKKLETATVAEVIAALQTMPPNMPLRIWLPGSTIALNKSAFNYKDDICIEGNVDPGSVLYQD